MSRSKARWTRKQIEAEIRECLTTLGLQNWALSVTISRESSKETGENLLVYAETHVDLTYRTVDVTVFPEFHDLPGDRKEDVLLHEVAHAITEEITEIARKFMPEDAHPLLDDANERLTATIALIVRRLLKA